MKKDPIVQDEIKRIYATSHRSEFEWLVLHDILDHARLTGAEYLQNPKKIINDYWEKKLK